MELGLSQWILDLPLDLLTTQLSERLKHCQKVPNFDTLRHILSYTFFDYVSAVYILPMGVRGWFGGGAVKKQKDTPKNAMLGLHTQLEMLQKRKKHLMDQMEEQDAIARKNANTNKNAARAALRTKKAYERSLDQTIAQIGTLELFASPQRSTVETSKQERTCQAYKEAPVTNTAHHPGRRSLGLRELVRKVGNLM
ncbi:hypothetical protein F5B21DRAFT_252309 [Xylaria acuta]|nr:hypothetical protein F5B21DRAFT_252309 [Xylaria acuta]